MWRRCVLGFALCALMWGEQAARAAAQTREAVGSPSGAGFECTVGAVQLNDVLRADPQAFVEHWLALLERIATCATRRSMQGMCVAVQPRFAAAHFVWGSVDPDGPAGESLLDAKARATLVRAKLRNLGIDAARVLDQDPPRQGSYDGVQIELTRDCGDGSGHLGEFSQRSAPSAPWAELELLGSGLWRGPKDAQSGLLRAGMGYHASSVYGRAFAGLALSSDATQRGGWEVGGAIGIELTRSVQLGIVGAFRQGANKLSASWLERIWSLGIESRQCRAIGGGLWELCLREAVLPIGEQRVRGQITNGAVFRLPVRKGPAVRADIGLSFMRGF